MSVKQFSAFPTDICKKFDIDPTDVWLLDLIYQCDKINGGNGCDMSLKEMEPLLNMSNIAINTRIRKLEMKGLMEPQAGRHTRKVTAAWRGVYKEPKEPESSQPDAIFELNGVVYIIQAKHYAEKATKEKVKKNADQKGAPPGQAD